MPLSELYHMSEGKFDSYPQKTTTCSTDPSFIPDNDFVELVWENGQILMQGQSSRPRKTTTNSNNITSYELPSHTFKSRDKDIGNGNNSKTGKFGTMDSILNDFPISSGEMGMNQDDDMVPWLNYAIDDDSLHQDYCSDFLTGLSGVTTGNELSTTQNSFASIEKRSGFNQTVKDSHSFSVSNGVSSEQQANASKVAGEVTRPKTSQLYPLSSQQCQTSVPSSYKSRISDVTSNGSSNASHHAVSEDLTRIQASPGGYPNMKLQKQDPGLPTSSSRFMNFSHFSRPAAVIKANLHSIGAVAAPNLPNAERMGCKDKGSVVASCANPAESIHLDSSNSLQKGIGSSSQPIMVPINADTKSTMAELVDEPLPAEQSGDTCHADAPKNLTVGSKDFKGKPDGEKTIEPALAASSVCSANSVDLTSNDPTNNLKRKSLDTEESDCPSEDAEEESVGAKKAGPTRGGTGSKRSRAAEVHNLSERKRRDRINEKMRALQELIPNCNKVDKASMLDEAIEYLKTLQLQVQIMSMGAGMYMPPMMLPTGMQHMHAAHMGHFSPMGVGMGMGFGMGMLDVNGGSPGFPIMQMPHMQGAHFRGPSISGPSSLHGMAGTNLQMFGLPVQGHPMSMAAHSPLIPVSAGPPMKSANGLNISGPGGHMGNLNSAQASSAKDPMHNPNLQAMHNTDANSLMNQASSQCQATNERFEQSGLVLKNDEAADVNGSGAVNSID